MGADIIFALALVAGLLFLLLLGLEIAWSVGVVALVGLIWFVDQPINQIAFSMWDSLNSFTLTAMPLFILMGSILGNTGVNERLFNAIDKWVGQLPGGLAVSVICGNAVFGAMSGSTIAATATFGKIAFPVMEQRKYNPSFSLGSIASGTVLAPLDPAQHPADPLRRLAGHLHCGPSGRGLIPGLTLDRLIPFDHHRAGEAEPRTHPGAG
jgi:TRAP-type mannitol/chloroaromatic compound transport system permease large subunit